MPAGYFKYYTRTFDVLDASLEGYINDTASNIIAAITPVATTLLIIYVMLWGWSMMRGIISEPITDGVGRLVRLGLIVGIALNLGSYNGFLSNMLWNSPDALASNITGNPSSSSVLFLDVLFNQMYDFGDAYYQKSFATSTLGIPSLGLFLVGIGFWAIGIVTTGFAAFLLILSKTSLAILLGVGPIFVLLIIFEPTKRFFDVWLGQTLNYVFLTMLTAAAIKLILAILQSYLTDASAQVLADPNIDQAMAAFALALVGILVLWQMPSISSALGGGVAISTLGAVGWTYRKISRSTSNTPQAMRSTYRTAMKTTGLPGAMYRKITGGRANRVYRN